MKKVVEVLCIIQLPVVFTHSYLILFQAIVTWFLLPLKVVMKCH